MTSQSSMTEFLYSQNSKKSSWTLTYVKAAFANTHHLIIIHFFKWVFKLVVAHNLISTAFKSHSKSKDMLSIKQSQYVDQLVTEFNDDIQIKEYFMFNSWLVKDVLIYQVNFEASNKIKRETINMLFFNSSSQKTVATSLILFKIISSTIITSNILFNWFLKDFELNCKFKQIISCRLICKLKVAQIAQSQLNKEFKLIDLQIEML